MKAETEKEETRSEQQKYYNVFLSNHVRNIYIYIYKLWNRYNKKVYKAYFINKNRKQITSYNS